MLKFQRRRGPSVIKATRATSPGDSKPKLVSAGFAIKPSAGGLWQYEAYEAYEAHDAHLSMLNWI
jgi:hypothetical protein